MNRRHLALLFFLVLGSIGAGCANFGTRYNINIGTSEPTEPTDKPGIWFDRERRTFERPDPILIKDMVVHFELVKPDGSREPIEIPARTSNQGWTFFRGKFTIPVDESSRFALRAVKKGYRGYERILTLEQVKDATMTIVLDRVPGAAAAPAPAASPAAAAPAAPPAASPPPTAPAASPAAPPAAGAGS
jgi:hypothetical protein